MATIACAWCEKELSRPSPEASDTFVSHGLCVACAARYGFFPAQDQITISAEEFGRLPFGVIEVDGQGVVCSYAPAATGLDGSEPPYILGRHFFSEAIPQTVACRLDEPFRSLVARGVTGGICSPFYFRTCGRERLVVVELIYNARQGMSRITVEELV